MSHERSGLRKSLPGAMLFMWARQSLKPPGYLVLQLCGLWTVSTNVLCGDPPGAIQCCTYLPWSRSTRVVCCVVTEVGWRASAWGVCPGAVYCRVREVSQTFRNIAFRVHHDNTWTLVRLFYVFYVGPCPEWGGGVHWLHSSVRWSPIWRIRAWRAWHLPGRWPDRGRGNTVARWTPRRASPIYAPLPGMTDIFLEVSIVRSDIINDSLNHMS